jgi:hypothetical protein
MGPLTRSARDHNLAPSGFFRTWADFQSIDAFSAFMPKRFGGVSMPGSLELNPHDVGHGFVGPRGRWMSNCRESNADPVFWAFHCHHDHLWALWQYHYKRFGTVGAGVPDVRDFAPLGNYAPGKPDPLVLSELGHPAFQIRTVRRE